MMAENIKWLNTQYSFLAIVILLAKAIEDVSALYQLP